MKKLAIALATVFTAGATGAFAADFQDRARVVAVHPINDRIPITREECWNDRQRGYEERRVTRSDTGAAIGPGTVLGAIIGGVAGHQVGNGRGNDAATAGGAVIGGLIGNQVDRDNRGAPGAVTEVERVPVERNVQRCRNVQEVREATVGFDVEYEFAGKRFNTRLDRDPGRYVRVAVNVMPVEGNEMPAPPPSYPPRPGQPAYR
jgi:uncharacterized protein YcfJ